LENRPLAAKALTAPKVRKLPPEQRDAILETAAALAEKIYCNNPALTEF
jgi:hypothetical protein